MPNPMDFRFAYAYLPNVYKADHFRFKMFSEQPRMGMSNIIEDNFVMNVRPNGKKYLKTLVHTFSVKGGLLINTVPAHAQQGEELKAFIKFMQNQGLSVLTVTTSGHANAKALLELMNTVTPKKMVPLIGENARVLYREYPITDIITDDDIWC